MAYTGQEAEAIAARERALGRAVSGTVSLKDFDRGIVETLGAVPVLIDKKQQIYVIKDIPGVAPAPGLPGVPVIFAFPEDVYEKYRLPVISVRRDSIDPQLSRWHPGSLQYRAPAPDAKKLTVTGPGGVTYTGWTKMVERQQAAPFDIGYTITISARYRGGAGVRNAANSILQYVMEIYQPYSLVTVTDSIGDKRNYDVTVDGYAPVDELLDITERTIGFALTLRVKGELDLLREETRQAVTKFPLGVEMAQEP